MRRIPGFPRYCVTKDGEVWSGRSRRVLRPSIDKDAYLRVQLWMKGRAYSRFVHRLVLEAFVGPCPLGMECCHNNGNASDNRLENLRWDSHKANCCDTVRHGTCPGLRCSGENHPQTTLTALDVRWIRYLGRAGVPRRDLAEVYGVTAHHVSRIIHRRTWK